MGIAQLNKYYNNYKLDAVSILKQTKKNHNWPLLINSNPTYCMNRPANNIIKFMVSERK